MKFSMTGQDKRDLFNTGDCLIQVTTWAGLTVCCFYTKYTVLKSNSKDQIAWTQDNNAGADPGFQDRGDALKKNYGERREVQNFWGYFM